MGGRKICSAAEENWLICRQSMLMRHLNKFERSLIFHRVQKDERNGSNKKKYESSESAKAFVEMLSDKVACASALTAVDRQRSDQKVCSFSRCRRSGSTRQCLLFAHSLLTFRLMCVFGPLPSWPTFVN